MMYYIFRSPRRVTLAIGSLLAVNLFVVYLLSREWNSRISHGEYLRCKEEVNKYMEQITALQHNLTSLVHQAKTAGHFVEVTVSHQQPNISLLQTIYMITPTYARWTQKADLTRLCQTLMHVQKLHWILVEDAEKKTMLVRRFLEKCKVTSTHLNIRTVENLRLKANEPVWRKNRGVEQRNLAVDWLREESAAGHLPSGGSVVYFGDDDNTYDIELFTEMRDTKKVAVWLVGISGGLRFEGPTCKRGKVIGWHTGWGVERPFPIDMAGFAINLNILISNPDAKMDMYAARGYLESSLLDGLLTMEELEPKGEDCTKVLVWHTRTEAPKTKHEDALIKLNKPSNPHIET